VPIGRLPERVPEERLHDEGVFGASNAEYAVHHADHMESVVRRGG